MSFLTTLTPEVLSQMFPKGAQHGYISGVVTVSPELDLIGFVVGAGTAYVAAFSGEDFADDLEFVQSLANGFTRFEPGEGLLPDARTVKFAPAAASPNAAFNQLNLPLGTNVWQFQRILTNVCIWYMQQMPAIVQFYFMPANEALDKWYNRLSKEFCKPGGALNSGIDVRRIAAPIGDEGGFYGYQRI